MTALNDALFSALSSPAPSPLAAAAGDAINSFTRAQMRRPSYFRFICPIIPEGAPWWEIGWEAEYVMEAVRRRAEDERMLRTRTMPRYRWKLWRSSHKGRNLAHTLAFDAKLAESARQMGRLAALIRSAGQ